MANYIEIVVLTKSAKNGGYCVAGVEPATNRWVRLVSNDKASHGALFERDIAYEDGSHCVPLDVVRVPFVGECPSEYQPENILVNPDIYWEKIGRITIEDLLEIHAPEKHDTLLGNIYPYITEERIGFVGHSLILVEVSNLVITHPVGHGTKASFQYRFTTYENIAVTDWDFRQVSDGAMFDQAVLVMSLPDTPYKERKYYKFIAKIFLL